MPKSSDKERVGSARAITRTNRARWRFMDKGDSVEWFSRFFHALHVPIDAGAHLRHVTCRLFHSKRSGSPPPGNPRGRKCDELCSFFQCIGRRDLGPIESSPEKGGTCFAALPLSGDLPRGGKFVRNVFYVIGGIGRGATGTSSSRRDVVEGLGVVGQHRSANEQPVSLRPLDFHQLWRSHPRGFRDGGARTRLYVVRDWKQPRDSRRYGEADSLDPARRGRSESGGTTSASGVGVSREGTSPIGGVHSRSRVDPTRRRVHRGTSV